MKQQIKSLLVLSLLLSVLTPAYGQLPYLKKEGKNTQFIVDGKPFIVLAGELYNSSSSSVEYLNSIWDKMSELNMNTIIGTSSWELIEPEEGKYNFKEIDAILEGARAHNMKVMLLWLASWKNSSSPYVPEWVKKNQKKYPLVVARDGSSLNILSAFHETNRKADEKAYLALLKHIKEVDYDNTFIMMQVENEVGILGAERDYSPTAEKAWKGQVPADLIDYLQKNKGKLSPELEKVWRENGYKTKGNWEEIFGKSIYPDDYDPDNSGYRARGRDPRFFDTYYGYTEELFMAYHYAKYIGQIAKAGKEVHNVPTYVNAWLRQPTGSIPGHFPSGGPTPETFDMWRAAAPAIDLYAPDIYIEEFDWVLNEYSRLGNPIFIPECTMTSSKALYAYGEYDAIGYGPFGIDGPGRHTDEDFEHVANTYKVLSNMNDIIVAHHGSDKMRGLMIDNKNPEHTIEMGDYIITATSSTRKKVFNYGQSLEQMTAEEIALARARAEEFTGGAIVFQTGKDEFMFVGYGLYLNFKHKDPSIKVRVASKDEGTFINNEFVRGRRLNGDEGGRGLGEQTGALKVRLYHYD